LIDLRTVPPETTTPEQTSELRAWPTRPRLVEDELAGARLVPREDRPFVVVEVEDRLDRDEIHVSLVVRVERPDVAASRPGRAPSPRVCRSPRSPHIGLTALDEIGMMSPAQSWFDVRIVCVVVTASISNSAVKT